MVRQQKISMLFFYFYRRWKVHIRAGWPADPGDLRGRQRNVRMSGGGRVPGQPQYAASHPQRHVYVQECLELTRNMIHL